MQSSSTLSECDQLARLSIEDWDLDQLLEREKLCVQALRKNGVSLYEPKKTLSPAQQLCELYNHLLHVANSPVGESKALRAAELTSLLIRIKRRYRKLNEKEMQILQKKLQQEKKNNPNIGDKGWVGSLIKTATEGKLYYPEQPKNDNNLAKQKKIVDKQPKEEPEACMSLLQSLENRVQNCAAINDSLSQNNQNLVANKSQMEDVMESLVHTLKKERNERSFLLSSVKELQKENEELKTVIRQLKDNLAISSAMEAPKEDKFPYQYSPAAQQYAPNFPVSEAMNEQQMYYPPTQESYVPTTPYESQKQQREKQLVQNLQRDKKLLDEKLEEAKGIQKKWENLLQQSSSGAQGYRPNPVNDQKLQYRPLPPPTPITTNPPQQIQPQRNTDYLGDFNRPSSRRDYYDYDYDF